MAAFIPREEPFTCARCGLAVEPLGRGTYRNHCPACLWSRHVDDAGPGDRASPCQGLMRPVALDQRSGKGWIIIHECERCGLRVKNKAAPDDNLQNIAASGSLF